MSRTQDTTRAITRLPYARLSLVMLGASLLPIAAGCGDDEPAPTTNVEPEVTVVGACNYESPFTGLQECREFVGDGWTESNVESECSSLGGNIEMGGACSTTYLLGRCELEIDASSGITIFSYGDAESCESQALRVCRWAPSRVERERPPPLGREALRQSGADLRLGAARPRRLSVRNDR